MRPLIVFRVFIELGTLRTEGHGNIVTCFHKLILLIISPRVRTAELTTALVVLLVWSAESTALLVLHWACGFNLDLGRGTGLTLTSD